MLVSATEMLKKAKAGHYAVGQFNINNLEWIGNYGLAIILFTLVTKLVLLPVSVWIHNNSILMVKIQPEINMLKVKYFGDSDTIADEQAKLFKRAK